MPKTIAVTLYTLAELAALPDKRGHGRALETLREHASATWGDHYAGDELQYYSDELAAMGATVAAKDIRYSGFWSQGDGLSFTGHVRILDLLKWAADPRVADAAGYPWPKDYAPPSDAADILARLSAVASCAWCKIERTCRQYSHEHTCRVDEYSADADAFDGCEVPEALLEEAAQWVERWRLAWCHVLYARLEADYDDRTSDAALAEDAEANGDTFEASGARRNA